MRARFAAVGKHDTNTVQPDTPDSLDVNRRSSWPPIYTFLILFILAAGAYLYQLPERGVMKPARDTLRSIGAAQLAYQYINNQKRYGTLENLQTAGYVSDDVTLGNMTTWYSLSWSIRFPDNDRYPGLMFDGASNFFTVLAWPQRDRFLWRDLDTYAITEDQVIRVYKPENGNKLDSITSWDPAE